MLAGDDKDLKAKALDAANKPYTPTPEPPSVAKASASTSFTAAPAFDSAPAFTAAPAFGSTAPAFGTEVAGFGGKPAPPMAPQPEL